MVDSLPRQTRLKLDQTLAQWRHWQCQPALAAAPLIERRLSGGLSNHSVLVASAEQRFVVRMDGIEPATHGLNRQTEWRVLQEAGRQQLAPAPRYFNPDLGTLVCDYLPADAQQPGNLEDVADLLRKIHELPAIHSRLDLRERVLRYERHLEAQGTRTALKSFHPIILHLIETCAQQCATRVVCHNDLLRPNRLYCANKLRALDWEYTAMASPWYELAVIAAGDSLNNTELDQLLVRYLRREASAGERQWVHAYTCVYRYLELLWYLAAAPALSTSEFLEQKTAELERALGGSPG